jgi:hypothetical protein
MNLLYKSTETKWRRRKYLAVILGKNGITYKNEAAVFW